MVRVSGKRSKNLVIRRTVDGYAANKCRADDYLGSEQARFRGTKCSLTQTIVIRSERIRTLTLNDFCPKVFRTPSTLSSPPTPPTPITLSTLSVGYHIMRVIRWCDFAGGYGRDSGQGFYVDCAGRLRQTFAHNRLVPSSSLGGATKFRKARREIYGPLSFLVWSISGPQLLPVSSGPSGQPKDSTQSPQSYTSPIRVISTINTFSRLYNANQGRYIPLNTRTKPQKKFAPEPTKI